jgi:hypothetical protein
LVYNICKTGEELQRLVGIKNIFLFRHVPDVKTWKKAGLIATKIVNNLIRTGLICFELNYFCGEVGKWTSGQVGKWARWQDGKMVRW